MADQSGSRSGRKFGLILAAISTLLLLLIFYFTYLVTKLDLRAELEYRQRAVLAQATSTIENFLSVAQGDLRFLSRSTLLRQSLTDERAEDWRQLEAEWLVLMQSRSNLYDQVRFIDNAGQERARVNNSATHTVAVPEQALQSKVNRYYVEESLKLGLGSLYLSDFDLNIERGVIEIPLKPTLRILTPVDDFNGVRQGVVALNYKGADMLAALKRVGQAWGQQLWMVNSEGYWLVGPSSELEWGFMYPGRAPSRLEGQFPQLWQAIVEDRERAIESRVEQGFQLSATPVHPGLGLNTLFDSVVLSREGGWTLVTAHSEKALQAQLKSALAAMVPAFGMIELFLIGLSLWGGRQIRLRVEAINKTETRERELTAIFESAPDALLMSNAQGVITRANGSVEALLGYKPESLIGEPIDLLVPDRIHHSHESLRAKYYQAPVPRSVSSRTRLMARRADGVEIPVSIALSSLLFDGEMQVISAVRDMSADHQASAEILTLNQRLKIATDAANIGIWELDTRDASLVWDQQMYAHYGLGSDFDLTVSNWLLLIDEDDRELVNHHMRETLLDGADFDLVVQARNAEGDEIWVRLIATTKRDAEGFTQTLIGTQLDVTEEVRIERELRIAYEKSSETNVELEALNQELEEAREAAEAGAQVKSDFLANMSHEIRTPLNAVLGINHLLERQVESSVAKELVAKQDRAAQSLLAIINDILDYSKIESGKLELEKSAFSLIELLDNLTTLLGEQANNKGLNFVVVPPPIEHNSVIGDYFRLEQVLVNLCSNAIKFTEKGEVRVSFDYLSHSASKLNVRFSVRDSGVGIPQSVRAHLFTPFTQADASVSRRFGGSGLGLSIVGNLVKLMGGEIRLESQIGVGSEFSFVLSLSRQPVSQSLYSGLVGRPVLLSHYKPGMAQALYGLLSAFGAKVEVLSDAQELVSRVLAQKSLQSRETIVLLDSDSYLPPDLENQLAPLAELPSARCPSLAVVCSTGEVWENDYTVLQSMFQRLQFIRYPIGPLALYNLCTSHESETKDESIAQEARLAGCRILVVDDNSINLDVAKMMLEEEGAGVWLATDGAEALRLLHAPQFSVDVVLMDVQMPGMDGLEATRKIRADEKLAQLPVLAVTAGVTPVQRSAAMEAGMDGFVTKPIEMQRVVSLIRSVISGRARDLAADNSRVDAKREESVVTEPLMLNEEYGLRVFKTPEKYQRYLHLFVQMYESTVEQLASLKDDPDLLRARVHKISGGAAQLGIEPVRDLCGVLKEQIDQGVEYSQTVDQLSEVLLRCFEQINRLYPPDKAGGVIAQDEGDTDPVVLAGPLKALYAELTDRELDRANLIFQGISNKLASSDRVALQNALDLFDVELASAEVERIASALGLVLE